MDNLEAKREGAGEELEVTKKIHRQEVTPREKSQEEDRGGKLTEYFKRIDAGLESIENSESPDKSEQVFSLLQNFSDAASLIHESRTSGFFELYQLAEFDNRLLGQFDRFSKLKLELTETAGIVLEKVTDIIELEKRSRELEELFIGMVDSVEKLNPSDEDIDPETLQEESLATAEKLSKCSDAMFNFEVGGIFRIDEFVTFFEQLQLYYFRLNKIFLGQNIEPPEEFKTMMVNIDKQLSKYEEIIVEFKQIIDGKDNVMSFEEYNEMAMKMAEQYKCYQENRKDNPEAVMNKDIEKEDPNKSPYVDISTTQDGKRFQIELKGRKGCEYARCANCCFFFKGSHDHNIKAHHSMKQLEGGLEDWNLEVKDDEQGVPQWKNPEATDSQDEENKYSTKDLYKIDLLSPGSFLNNREMPKSNRTAVFEKIAKLPFKLVLIEARVEHVLDNPEEISRLQEILRPDQRIQVAIGFESSSDAIREISIAKGYTKSDFEKAVRFLASNDVDVQAYSIVKPALLDERQARDDSVKTGNYLADLAEKVRQQTGKEDFQMTMKLEPAFIQEGGFLDHLNQNDLYKTPWMYTIADVIDKLHAGDPEISKKLNLQVGTSGDFPPPDNVAKNRLSNGETCLGSTKGVIDLLQQFNSDHDVTSLREKLKAIKSEHAESTDLWEKQMQKENEK